MNLPGTVRRIPSKKFYVTIGLVLLAGLGGCETLASLEAAAPDQPQSAVTSTPIQDITSGKVKQAVQIRGNVGTIAPLVGGSAYEVEDGTAKIWVMTKTAAPEVGTTVTVKGQPRLQQLRLDGGDRGSVYLEQD